MRNKANVKDADGQDIEVHYDGILYPSAIGDVDDVNIAITPKFVDSNLSLEYVVKGNIASDMCSVKFKKIGINENGKIVWYEAYLDENSITNIVPRYYNSSYEVVDTTHGQILDAENHVVSTEKAALDYLLMNCRDQIFEKLRSLIDIKLGESKKIDKESIDKIATLSSGDYRAALNLLEVCYYSTTSHKIDLKLIESINNKPILGGDANGDNHYQLISAFQKSIRGSDPDAAVYYLGRLLAIGDLDIIYRRMTVVAYEDIGLANPSMGPKVRAAIEAAEMLGMPEARIPLSDVVIELAMSPKSNSGICAIDDAMSLIEKGNTGEVPYWINSEMNPNYKYPHNYPNHWVEQQYLPDNIKNAKFYKPGNNKYETTLDNGIKEMKK